MSKGDLRKRMALGAVVVILALAFVALTLAGCASGSTQAGAQGTPLTTPIASSEAQTSLVNTITVSGTGTVSTLPDEAVIQIGVQNSATTAAAALDQNSKETQKVLARLKADGVPDSAIETTNVAVYPNYSYPPKTGTNAVSGYQATNSVNVTVTDFKLIGPVFAAAAEAGANNISGPAWQLSENSQAEAQALTLAAANARAKAEALAASQGLTVGDVLIIDETSSSPILPIYNDTVAPSAGTPSVSTPPVSPQNLDVTASVSITYQLKH
jgi:uncharacterized protein YggE